MNKFKKNSNPGLPQSAKKKLEYPKMRMSSKRSIGKLHGAFDQALLHLGVAILEEEAQVIEE
jgi:hypothetical protein